MTNINNKSWYLITSKPHKDAYAEEQLINQGYEVYRPVAKYLCTRKKIQIVESLFPRYLFIKLEAGIDDWGPIRSTRGVQGIVKFGVGPAKVGDELINEIRSREDSLYERAIDLDRFQEGQVVIIDTGPFSGLNGLFSKYAGDHRVIILMDLLGRQTSLTITSSEISLS